MINHSPDLWLRYPFERMFGLHCIVFVDEAVHIRNCGTKNPTPFVILGGILEENATPARE